MATIGVIELGMRASTAMFAGDLKAAGGILRDFSKSQAALGKGQLKDGLAGIGSGLRRSLTDVKGGIAEIGGSLAKLGSGAGRLGFAAIGSGARAALTGARALAGGLAQLATKIASIGTVAAGVAVAGLAAWVAEGLKAVDSTGDLAARIGTTTESLTSLRYATQLTGSESEVLDGALQKMNANLADAAQKGGPTADALGTLGLNARELAQLDPAEAFRRIVAGFSRIPNPAQRAALAMDLFGKSGLNLVNTLSAGPEELARLEEEARKLGITFSAVDASKVGAANDAFDRISGVFQGIKNQLAIQLAPLITEVGERFVRWGTDGEGAASRVSAAMEGTVSVIGGVADAAQWISGAFEGARSFVTAALKAIVDALGLFARGIDAVTASLPGVATAFGETLSAISEDLDRLSNEQWERAKERWAAPPPSSGVRQFFDGVRAGANEAAAATANAAAGNRGLAESYTDVTAKIRELEKSLGAEVKTFGLSSHQTEIAKLAADGAKDEDLAKLKELAQTLEVLEKLKKKEEEVKSKAKSVFTDSLTPLEKYNQKLAELNELLERGAIDQETYNRARTKAGQELAEAGAQQHAEKKGPALLELGSEELRSAQLRQAGPRPEDFAKDTAQAAKQQVTLQQRGNQLLAAIAGKFAPGALGLEPIPIGN